MQCHNYLQIQWNCEQLWASCGVSTCGPPTACLGTPDWVGMWYVKPAFRSLLGATNPPKGCVRAPREQAKQDVI